MTPQLSVIIPTYKRTYSLEKVLDCLIKQENIKLEIIVVDQNEENIFSESLRLKLLEVIHIIQPKPNASLARNTGFKKSTAPYILFLDDDLIPDADFCKKGFDVFKDYPLIQSFVPLVYTDEGKELASFYLKKKLIEYYPNDRSVFSITEAISAAVFFEKTYFQLTGGFDTYLFDFAKAAEDIELFLRMIQRNMTLWFVSSIQIFHDENVAGGCDLRTAGYWVSRKKNTRAMAYRLRSHNENEGTFSLRNLIQISRSFVINKKVLKSGVKNILKEMKLLIRSIKESKEFYLRYRYINRNSQSNFIDD